MPAGGIMSYDGNSDRRLTRQDRERARLKGEIKTQVELRGFMIDGAAALGAHFMDVAIELDEHRRDLADGDPTTNILLAEVEATFIRQGKRIQNSLYSQWEM